MSEQKYCIFCMEKIPGDSGKCPFCGGIEKEYKAEAHHLIPYTILNGKYLIGRVLGEGGFGITYIARDLNLDMRVAVKEYYPYGCVNRNHSYSESVTVSGSIPGEEFEAGKKKLMQEARTLARFSDLKGIVGVRDFFLHNNTAYVVMDFLEGITLKEYLKTKKTMTFDEVMSLLAPVIHDLIEVHESGLIHRDISPDNIMVLKDGSARLLDFGAARQTEGGNAKSLSIVLKPGYTPEEQYRTRGEQGPWTDVYALSATIYRAITGTLPDEALQRMVKDDLKKPSELNIAITPEQEQALMKGLAVYKKDRYQNVEQLLKGLKSGQTCDASTGNPQSAKISDIPIPFPKKKAFLAAGAVFLVLLLGISAAFALKKPAEPEADMMAELDEMLAELELMNIPGSLSSESEDEISTSVYEASEMNAVTDTNDANEAIDTISVAPSDDRSEASQDDSADIDMNSLNSFAVKIDGEIYQFPMTYDEFTGKGWDVSFGDPEKIIEPGRTGIINMDLNGSEAMVFSYNGDNRNRKLNECYIAGIDMEEKLVKDYVVLIPKGLQVGIATRKDIVEAYGDLAVVYEGNYQTTLTYNLGDDKEWKFTLDTASGKLTAITVKNRELPEGFIESAVSTQPTKEELSYTAPTALGNDVMSDIVEYDGDLYRLPCPLSAMIQNGWQISPSTAFDSLAAGESRPLYILRNGKSPSIYINNLDSEAHLLENCFVTDMHSTFECTMVLPEKIAVGMDENKLLEILDKSGYEYKKDTVGDYSIYRDKNTSSPNCARIDIKDGIVDLVRYSKIEFND